MKNGDLIIDGVEIQNIDLDAMNYEQYFDFTSRIYDALDTKWGKESKLEFDDVFDEDFVNKLNATRERVVAENQAARAAAEFAKPLIVDGVAHTKIAAADVLWHGWECDGTVWVAKDDTGQLHVITTDHGTPKLSDQDFLKNKIEEYKKAIEQTQALLDMMKA